MTNEDELERLRAENALLNDQVKIFARTEQRLFQSQRELDNQLERIQAFADLALRSSSGDTDDIVVNRIGDLLTSLFHLDCVLVLRYDSKTGARRVWRNGTTDQLAVLDAELTSWLETAPPVTVLAIDRWSENRFLGALMGLAGESELPRDPDPAGHLASLVTRGEDNTFALFAWKSALLPRSVLRQGLRPSHESYLHIVAGYLRRSIDNIALTQALATRNKELARTNALLSGSLETLRETQEKLLQSMTMESIGRLAGGVAHDFNNLLTVIIGNTALAMMKLRSDDPLYKILREVEKAAESAAALTRQLLTFARKQMIEPRVLDLNDLISNLQRMLVRLIGEDIELQVLGENPLRAVKIDPSQLEQVLINLVVNSRDSMPDGGKLTIETSSAELDDTYCAQHPDVQPGRYALLAVSDTGHGMSADVKEHLFEPFFTTKPNGIGTGLGLATIYGVVKQAGGAIEVYSELGHGTTFKIYLPCVDHDGKVSVRQGQELGLPGGNETVMLVEDEPQVRDLTCRVLSELGYSVLQAGNGADAIALADNYKEHIDLLITDVVMPGMNGRELSECLMRLHPEMRVLFTSGYSEDAIAHHGIVETGIHFVGKPYTLLALASKIRELLQPAG